MSEICRKDSLTRNMSRMNKMFPKDYAFYPKAWCLPAEYDFVSYEILSIFVFYSINKTVTVILLNIIQKKSIRHIYQNQMLAVKAVEYL